MRYRKIKVTRTDGSVAEFKTIAEAAADAGVNYSRFGTWLHILNQRRKGRPAENNSMLNSSGWRRFGIKNIEYSGGRRRPSYTMKKTEVVWKDGERKVFASRRHAARKLKVCEITIFNWLKGRCALPPDLESICDFGKKNLSYGKRRLKVKRLDGGREFPVGRSRELARIVGVSEQTISNWIKGKQPIPRKYNLASVQWEDEENLSRVTKLPGK